jgi:hypothetical protein
MSLEYSIKLKDPRWQKKRLEIFKRDDWACRRCHSTVKTLTIHHRYYNYGIEPWEYPDDALITLCQDCHHEITSGGNILRCGLGLTEALFAVGEGMVDDDLGEYKNHGFNLLRDGVLLDRGMVTLECCTLISKDGGSGIEAGDILVHDQYSCAEGRKRAYNDTSYICPECIYHQEFHRCSCRDLSDTHDWSCDDFIEAFGR